MSSGNSSAPKGKSALLVGAVRLLFGADLLINGVNWWFKLIGPYPSLSDYLHHAPPADFVGAMIQTGVLFHIVKATELLTGLALLTNRFVPLMLVVVFPITVPVFVVDVLLVHHLRGFVMGAGAMLMNTFLLLSYLSCYRGILRARAIPDAPACLGQPVTAPSAAAAASQRPRRWLSLLLRLYGTIAALFGVAMLMWVAVMMAQYLMR
jgi:hypothetical protein